MKITRRLCAWLCCLTLLVGTMPVWAKRAGKMDDFVDLKYDWSYESIEWCVANNIMKGTSETTFQPTMMVSRGQFVTTLSRLAKCLGFNLNGYTYVDVFPDAPGTDSWYAQGVAWGYKNNIVKGYDNGNFGTNDTLTRQDMATLMFRFIYQYLSYEQLGDKTGGDGGLKDVALAGEYARGAIRAMNAIGLMSGADHYFYPRKGTTRAELAAVLQRLATFADTEGVLTPYSYMKQGINLYTYMGNCDIVSTGNDPDTVFRNLYDAGIDHVRIQLYPNNIGDYGNNPFDPDPNCRNFYLGTDGKYHMQISEVRLNNAFSLCRSAVEAGLGVVLDNHNYWSYLNPILQPEKTVEWVRARLTERKEEMAALGNATDEIDQDFVRLDRFSAALEQDALAATENLYNGGACDYTFRGFSDDGEYYLTQVLRQPDIAPEQFAETWAAIAEKMKALPVNVFFELINEVSMSGETVEAAVDAIRKTGGTNAQRMIVVYSYCWEYYDGMGGPLSGDREEWDFGAYNDDPNIMFDIHNYNPTSYSFADFQTNMQTWPAPDSKNVVARNRMLRQMTDYMEAAVDLRLRTRRHVWIGEYGCCKGLGNREGYLRDYISAAASYNLPTCIWVAGDRRAETGPSGLVTYFYNTNEWAEGTLAGIFG